MPIPPVEGEEAFDDPREDEVDDLRCLWCKLHMGEADDDLRYHELGTGEVLCGNCLGDARSFKRGVDVQLLVSTEFEDAVPGLKTQISAAMWEAGEGVLQKYGGEFNDITAYRSNAAVREEEDPSVERKADLTPADMNPEDDEDDEPRTDGGQQPEAEAEYDGREVRIGGSPIYLSEEDTVFSVFDRLADRSPHPLRTPDPDYSALYREDDVEEDGSGEVVYPDPEDRVPADLSTVEDGDELHLFRMKASDRPIYTEDK